MFPAERLVESLDVTLAGLGVDLHAQSQRSSRHRAAARRSRRGRSAHRCGCRRRSTSSSLRSAGATTSRRCFTRRATPSTTGTPRRDLAFEFRHLGDNSVTESFAFLMEHLTEDPVWLARRARDRRCLRGDRPGPRLAAGVAAPVRGEDLLRARAPRRRARPGCDAGALRRAARRGDAGHLASRRVPLRRRPGLLRRLLPAGLGAGDPLAAGAARALRRALVPLAGGRGVAPAGSGPMASGSTPTSCSPRSWTWSLISRSWRRRSASGRLPAE